MLHFNKTSVNVDNTPYLLRQGSHARDSSAATARSSPVILSAAKDLAAARDRPFAEFTLSEAHVLRVTRGDCSNGQVLFFTWNLALGSKCIKQPAGSGFVGCKSNLLHKPA